MEKRFGKHSKTASFTILLACAAFARTASAVNFFSIDVNFARLHIISSTGGDTDVGPLDFVPNSQTPELAYLNGRLYLIDSTPGSNVAFYEVNTSTGHATAIGTLSSDGTPIRDAKSLTTVGSSLYVGFNLSNSGPSTLLAPLSLTGTVTSATTATTNFDLDATAWNGSEWRGIDINNPSFGNSTLFGGSTPTFSSIASASNSALGINDLDYAGTDLWGIRTLDRKLVRISPTTGAVLETVTFATSGIYSSLAADPASIPEPSMLGYGLLGLMGLTRVRRAS